MEGCGDLIGKVLELPIGQRLAVAFDRRMIASQRDLTLEEFVQQLWLVVADGLLSVRDGGERLTHGDPSRK
jgi:hypothetical protein